jgi:hypothetical protein
VYSRATETEAMQAKVLTADKARRIAISIARLPELQASVWIEFPCPTISLSIGGVGTTAGREIRPNFPLEVRIRL